MKILLAHADPVVIGVAIGLGIGELLRRLAKGKEKKEAEEESS